MFRINRGVWEMKLEKITDRIYYLPNEKENDRPVLGYIEGDKHSLVVDAGNSSHHVKKLYEELKDLNLRMPDYTVITHWHWDHTFGMHSVEGKTIASKDTNLKLKEVMGWNWSDDDMEERLRTGEDIEMCDTCIRVEYKNRDKIKVVCADMELDGNMKIDLGGICAQIIKINSPHSDDAVIVYIPEQRIVFLGDAYCEDFYYNNGRYDKEKLLDFINLIDILECDTCVIGHDRPYSKEEMITYLKNEL